MSQKRMLFIPITKVDEEKRLVYGTLAVEEPDHSGEILDYEASKPAIKAWTEHFSKVTDGKSAGNLRVMHGDIVAGHFTEVGCDDDTKSFPVVAKVTDDQEWKKVQEGDYTGFSIGARAAWRKKDEVNPKLTRYAVGKLVEGSLVDAPCIPSATFEYIKAENQIEIRKFNVQSNSSNSTDSRYDKSVATDFKADFKTAHASLEKVGSTERNIAAFKKSAQSAGIRKSLFDVSDLACVLMSANFIRQNLVAEAQWEGDSSPIPEKLRTWVDAGAQLLGELVAEESAEMTQDAPLAVEIDTYADKEIDIAKGDKKDEAVMADATKTETKVGTEVTKTEQPDVTKSVAAALEPITKKFDEAVSKLNEKTEAQETALKSLTDSVQTMTELLKKIPAPMKGIMSNTIAVSKEMDKSSDKSSSTPVTKDPAMAFKMALAPENATPIYPA